MIIDSLETLKKMSGPDIFEHVARHLLTQNKKAQTPINQNGEDFCRYRTTDKDGSTTLACAVGCLIPDEAYNEEFFENRTITDLFRRLTALETRTQISGLDSEPDLQVLSRFSLTPSMHEALHILKPHKDLLKELQEIHDNSPTDEWIADLRLRAAQLDHDLARDIVSPMPLTQVPKFAQVYSPRLEAVIAELDPTQAFPTSKSIPMIEPYDFDPNPDISLPKDFDPTSQPNQ